MSSNAALQTIRHWRLQQFHRLESHIQRLRPLSRETTPKLGSNAKAVVLPNPFIPRKNPATGKWRPPAYSLRKQAELVKKAKASGTLHLLPPGPKMPQLRLGVAGALQDAWKSGSGPPKSDAKDGVDSVWQRPVVWEGKVKEKKTRGADLGITLYAGKKKMFKGHKWERVLRDRLRKRKILLRDMKKRIFNYKNYYKRRRPDPLKPARTVKSPKLPF